MSNASYRSSAPDQAAGMYAGSAMQFGKSREYMDEGGYSPQTYNDYAYRAEEDFAR